MCVCVLYDEILNTRDIEYAIELTAIDRLEKVNDTPNTI